MLPLLLLLFLLYVLPLLLRLLFQLLLLLLFQLILEVDPPDERRRQHNLKAQGPVAQRVACKKTTTVGQMRDIDNSVGDASK
jgi:hypothetical protein